MRNLFPEYADSSANDHSKIWSQALFVFDTNVLLNLYRYQSSTRDELLNVLRQLSPRIWVPHHVALEFQRNRLKVIAEQNKRFSDVRRTIEKAGASLFEEIAKLQLQKRHALIDPEPLLAGFQKLSDDFAMQLDRLHETQQKLTEPDPLKQLIEQLFDGRVGDGPNDQNEVDGLYKLAETRYKLKIPPGYLDEEKEKGDTDEYFHANIIYKRKYGDFLVWHQLLTYAKNTQAASVIFVTDDGKDDWWWKIELNGSKTIGPRPELISEARTYAAVDSFLMYSPESFLKYAQAFLKAKISEETLKDVRDVSVTRSKQSSSLKDMRETVNRVQDAVALWLNSQYESVEVNERYFPDLIAYKGGKRFGFEVKYFSNPNMAGHTLRDMIYRAYYELKEGRVDELTVVYAVQNSDDIDLWRRALSRSSRDEMPDNIWVVIGVIDDQESGTIAFRPIYHFKYNSVGPRRAQYDDQYVTSDSKLINGKLIDDQ